jgi:hypothetical protein
MPPIPGATSPPRRRFSRDNGRLIQEALSRLTAGQIAALEERLLQSAAFRAVRPSPFRTAPAAGGEPPMGEAERERLLGFVQEGKNLLRNRGKIAATEAAKPAQFVLPVHLDGRPEPTIARQEIDRLLALSEVGRGILKDRRDQERRAAGLS